jgi:hypothetical protein
MKAFKLLRDTHLHLAVLSPKGCPAGLLDIMTVGICDQGCKRHEKREEIVTEYKPSQSTGLKTFGHQWRHQKQSRCQRNYLACNLNITLGLGSQHLQRSGYRAAG